MKRVYTILIFLAMTILVLRQSEARFDDCPECDMAAQMQNNRDTLALIKNITNPLNIVTCDDVSLKVPDESKGKTYDRSNWIGSLSYQITPSYRKYYRANIPGMQNVFYMEIPRTAESINRGNHAFFQVEYDSNNKLKSVRNLHVKLASKPDFTQPKETLCNLDANCAAALAKVKAGNVAPYHTALAPNAKKIMLEEIDKALAKGDQRILSENAKLVTDIKAALKAVPADQLGSPDALRNALVAAAGKPFSSICPNCADPNGSIKDLWAKQIEPLQNKRAGASEDEKVKINAEINHLLDLQSVYLSFYNVIHPYKNDAFEKATMNYCETLNGNDAYCSNLNAYYAYMKCISPQSVYFFQDTLGENSSAMLTPVSENDITH